MSGYRHEWDCCDTVTVTQAWEPERCPFCELDELRAHVCTDNSDTLKNALTDNAKLRALLERAAGLLRDAKRVNLIAPEFEARSAFVLAEIEGALK